jgi:hypothetical protein
MAKNIRSNYIKNLISDKDELNKSLRESTKDALKDIVDEAVNKNLRLMISEADEDEYDEEEVNPENELDTVSMTSDDEGKGTDDEDTTSDNDTVEDNSTEDVEDDDTSDSEGTENDFFDGMGEEPSDEEDGEDVWDSIEKYKDMDGEYDLTSMGSEDVVKVLRVMKPEDGIRVVKNDDGNITLTDDNNDTEYIIQLEGDEAPEDKEFDYEVEVGDDDDDDVEESYSRINEYDSHVGYDAHYGQNKTAMTTPPNNEPANPKTTYSMDDGVPKGTEQPWAGKGDNSPFNQKVKGEVEEGEVHNNCCNGKDCEVEECNVKIEEHSGPEGFVGKNSTAKTHHNTNKVPEIPRNGSEGGEHVKPTSVARYSSGESNESILRKAKAIFRENKELKDIAEQIKERLQEACTINASLGKIIKLITENTTTRDEKIDIVNRFNNVKTISETNRLYETISRELKNAHQINNNVDKVMNGQLSEARKRDIVETSMYQSDDLAATREFMNRLNKIK